MYIFLYNDLKFTVNIDSKNGEYCEPVSRYIFDFEQRLIISLCCIILARYILQIKI